MTESKGGRSRTPEQRFWSFVDKNGPVPTARPELGPCWMWNGARWSNGYGQFTVDGRRATKHKFTGAHRFSCALHLGHPIDDDLEVDHLCRVHPCVNPAHLEPVPKRENLRRGETFVAENLAKTHCPKGHPYDEENTYVRDRGSRECRICIRERADPGGTRSKENLGAHNRVKTHCPHGHEYTAQNTRLEKCPSGWARRCRTCEAERGRRRAGRAA